MVETLSKKLHFIVQKITFYCPKNYILLGDSLSIDVFKENSISSFFFKVFVKQSCFFMV